MSRDAISVRVVERHEPRVPPPGWAAFPLLFLVRDAWDDFGYRTMFHAILWLSGGENVDLDVVKILRAGQKPGPTDLPAQFGEVGPQYCSLGQAYSYYERVAALPADVGRPLLRALGDVVEDDERRAAFEHEPGFVTSLLRFDGARTALSDARPLFARDETLAPHTAVPVTFSYKLPSDGPVLAFRFDSASEIPTDLAVIVGYNGVGKTRLLANLAHLAVAGGAETSPQESMDPLGRWVGQRPEFGSVITISYSAFDDFEIPQVGNRSAAQSYTYCGLRMRGDDPEVMPDEAIADKPPTQLKSVQAFRDEFARAWGSAGRHRPELLEAAASVLFAEPSFSTVVHLPDLTADVSEWVEAFDAFSSGHKIAANVVAQLCAYLEPRALVLVDEPELHLHPPLVSALVRALVVALRRYQAVGIVATHSPVVLQEVPSASVQVLHRSFSSATGVSPPAVETFAENVGTLTREVFSLDSQRTDWQGVLRALAAEKTLEQIEALFPLGLSGQARAYVLSALGGPGAAER